MASQTFSNKQRLEEGNIWFYQEYIDLPSSQFISNKTSSLLQFNLHSDRDYGTVHCVATNSIGTQITPCYVELVKKSMFENSFNNAFDDGTIKCIDQILMNFQYCEIGDSPFIITQFISIILQFPPLFCLQLLFIFRQSQTSQWLQHQRHQLKLS